MLENLGSATRAGRLRVRRRARILGHLGPLSVYQYGYTAGPASRPWVYLRISPEQLESRTGPDAPAGSGILCCRPRWWSPNPRPACLPVSLPTELLGKPAALTIRREDGTSATLHFDLQQLPDVATHGIGWPRVCAETVAALPEDLPLGYHDISVLVDTLAAETRYIVTPDRAWTHPSLGRTGRTAGVALSLYGVRSARNWGCGDFRDLQAMMDWVAEDLGASFVGLNPLHAIHNRKPFNTSPYLPNCIFYQNFIYLDVEGIQDYPRCRRAQRLRWRKETCAEIESLRSAPLVEYERVAALKLRFLKLLFVQFLREWRGGSLRGQSFRSYVAREGDLLQNFATYCALDEYLHRQDPEVWIWTQWPGRIPRSGVARDPFVPGQTLALRNVLSIFAVANRHTTGARSAVGAVAPPFDRPLPRSRPGDGPLRRGSLGAPALLHSGLPRRFAAG
jgi:hypothetical protein